MKGSLNEIDIYQVLSDLLPKQNDFYVCDYHEELDELLYFGISKKEDLVKIISKHRDKILEIDRSEIDDFHVKLYSEEYGKEYIEERLENKYWFAYPALLRIALELEFGEKYRKFSEERDK